MTKLTDRYRIMKSQLGKKPEQISIGTKDEMLKQLSEITDKSFKYYLEDEVYTTNSLKDSNKKETNSLPYWRQSK